MIEPFALEPAEPTHIGPVQALLGRAALPLDGLEGQFPDAYVVARVAGELVGVAGLELHGPHALLRSVVVADAARGRGIGHALVRERLAHARTLGLARVFLLTTTAAPFFEALGFNAVSRAAAPAALAATAEFAAACPATAACLCLSL
jgi:amino-acid N-acetyltransferase